MRKCFRVKRQWVVLSAVIAVGILAGVAVALVPTSGTHAEGEVPQQGVVMTLTLCLIIGTAAAYSTFFLAKYAVIIDENTLIWSDYLFRRHTVDIRDIRAARLLEYSARFVEVRRLDLFKDAESGNDPVSVELAQLSRGDELLASLLTAAGLRLTETRRSPGLLETRWQRAGENAEPPPAEARDAVWQNRPLQRLSFLRWLAVPYVIVGIGTSYAVRESGNSHIATMGIAVTLIGAVALLHLSKLGR
jgi:hypothetical protein